MRTFSPAFHAQDIADVIYIASLNYHQIICNLLVFHKKLIHKLLISGLPAIPSDHLPFFGSSSLFRLSRRNVHPLALMIDLHHRKSGRFDRFFYRVLLEIDDARGIK